MKTRILNLLAFSLAFTFSEYVTAQQNLSKKLTRISGELGGGIPVMFGSIPNNITTFGNASLRYSLLKEVSVGVNMYVGTFSGSQTPPGPYQSPSRLASNYFSFNNNFLQYGGFLQLNLEPIFKLRQIMPRINPYVFGGMGRINSNIKTESLIFNNTRQSFEVPATSYFNYFTGISLKYYLNPQLDLVVTASYHGTQTTALDGIPGYPNTSELKAKDPAYFDSYIMPFIGINYKFTTGSNKEHIEWYNVIYYKHNKAKEQDYQEARPIVQQTNNTIEKDSIDKVLSENKLLKLENDSLRKEIINLNEKVENLTKENRELKEQKNSQTHQIIEPDISNQKQYETKEKKQIINRKRIEEVKIQEEYLSDDLNVSTPPEKYNVVVGCYTNTRYAFLYRDKMRSLGYNANVFNGYNNSRMLRVTILSTSDQSEARRVMRMARKNINSGSWIYIYDK